MTDDIDALVARLTRAGVISHIVRLTGEPACLEQDAVTALLSRVGHSIFRIAPFVYGVQIGGEDATPVQDALAGELSAMLNGTEVEVTRTHEGPMPAEGPEQTAILLLRALPDGVAAAGEGDLRAVIDARYAGQAADLTAARIEAVAAGAGGATAQALEDLGTHLAALETRLAAPPSPDFSGIEARLDSLEQRLATRAATDGAEARAGMEALAARLDRRLDRLESWLSEDRTAERLAGLETGIAALPDAMARIEARLPAEDGETSRDATVSDQIAARLAAIEDGLGQITGAGAQADPGAVLSRLETGLSDLAARVAALAPSAQVLQRLAEVADRPGAGDGALPDALAARLDRLETQIDQLCAGEATREAAEARLLEAADRLARALEAQAGAGTDATGLAADLRTLPEAVAALSARLDRLAETGDAGREAAEARERLMRAGLAELAARIEIGGLGLPQGPG